MLNYDWIRLLKCGAGGSVDFRVINRPLDTGSAVLPVDAAYPVNWEDRGAVRRARQHYEMHRIGVTPEWAAALIPGSERHFTPAEESAAMPDLANSSAPPITKLGTQGKRK